ncbi:unnamed protein product [Paramecium sonneborni]|uniref:Uncharacterized protein n=1 Tax=Paramecium sonneborni TaxID=65129 RepID=A0A8S1RTI5_9CILI|nr:unnamed protein product [Paramecium sonneborni]
MVRRQADGKYQIQNLKTSYVVVQIMMKMVRKFIGVKSIKIYQSFSNSILQIGSFSKGIKVGRWQIIYQANGKKDYKQIGGGSYNLEGNLKKIGKWEELDEGFNNQKQVIYKGEYNQNGIKQGRWDIMFDSQGKSEYKLMEIISGGGSYDLEGNLKKIGIWIELDEGFNNQKQIIYTGEYNINVIKQGRWDILFDNLGKSDYKLIGGGSYDLEGNQKKIGKWEDLDEGFNKQKLVIYKGEYNLKGIKIGKWDIMFDRWGTGDYNQIGGGSYDLEGNQQKLGYWVDLDDEFSICKQVTNQGDYNVLGKKTGIWMKKDLVHNFYYDKINYDY